MWVHTNNAFINGYDAIITAYEAAHPNVDIQLENFDYELYLQTLQTAMPAGEEADILQLFGTWTSQYYERLAPVPELVMTIEEAQKTFYAAPIGGFIVDGKLYGLPQEFNCEYGGVLVNKTLYEAAGLTYPPQWKSMDDVLADAEALAKKDDGGMMTTAGFHFTSADPTGLLLPGRHQAARRRLLECRSHRLHLQHPGSQGPIAVDGRCGQRGRGGSGGLQRQHQLRH